MIDNKSFNKNEEEKNLIEIVNYLHELNTQLTTFIMIKRNDVITKCKYRGIQNKLNNVKGLIEEVIFDL